MSEVSGIGDTNSTASARQIGGRDPVSAVRMPEKLTAVVDAWAEARRMSRSDAICQLVALGLTKAPAAPVIAGALPRSIEADAARIEALAVHEIGALLDPALPEDERERRIRRLTEGPPEFSHERIDLPKHRA
jgi:hypothetical protein